MANFDEIDLKFRSTKCKSSFSSQFGCRFKFESSQDLTEEYINFVQKVFSLQSRYVWLLYQPTRSSYFTTAMKKTATALHSQENVWCILNRPQAKISWQPNAAQTAECSVCVKSFSFHCTALHSLPLLQHNSAACPCPHCFDEFFKGPKTLYYDPKSKCFWLDNTCGKEVFFHLFFKREMYQIALLYMYYNRTVGRSFFVGEGKFFNI